MDGFIFNLQAEMTVGLQVYVGTEQRSGLTKKTCAIQTLRLELLGVKQAIHTNARVFPFWPEYPLNPIERDDRECGVLFESD